MEGWMMLLHPPPRDAAPWLYGALGEVGVREVPGVKHDRRILWYHDATTLDASRDEVPWCASFVGRVLLECGIEPTRSAMARSYLEWGVRCEPRPGAVVVFSRGEPPSGHVAFYLGRDRRGVWVVGGNQSDAVTITTYAPSRVLAYRWPERVARVAGPVVPS